MAEDFSQSQNASSSKPPISGIKAMITTALPTVLRLPESLLQWTAGAIGILLGLGTSVLVKVYAPESSFLGRMFGQDFMHAFIPTLIFSVFFWAISICIVRWFRLRALLTTSGKSILLAVTTGVETEGDVRELAGELKDCEYSPIPLLRRLRGILEQWMISPSLQNADIILQQHVVSDSEQVQAGYNLVRIFIWALPVLGLIGTVLGIAEAVGGFAQFLAGSVEDVSVIKKSLVGVTGGLSFAFLITLQGLLTVLVVMLVASPLQTLEEQFYAAIQNDISNIFLPKLQRISPELKALPSSELTTAWRDLLAPVASEMNQIFHTSCMQTSLRALEEMDRRHDAYLRELSERLDYLLMKPLQDHAQVMARIPEKEHQLLRNVVERQNFQLVELAKFTQEFRKQMEVVADMQKEAFTLLNKDLNKAIHELIASLPKTHAAEVESGSGQAAESGDFRDRHYEIPEDAEEPQSGLEGADPKKPGTIMFSLKPSAGSEIDSEGARQAHDRKTPTAKQGISKAFTRLLKAWKGPEVASTTAGEGEPKFTTDRLDLVQFSVTSPSVVSPGSSFIVDVWAHLEELREAVLQRVREAHRGRDIQIKSKGPIQLSRGTVLTVYLKLDEMVVDEPEDTILWEGDIGNATFMVKVPWDVDPGTKAGTAVFFVDGLRIGWLNFSIEVGILAKEATALASEMKWHRTAFASYASEDRDAVLDRLQGIMKGDPRLNVFIDVLRLRSGQNWAEELIKVIPRHDVFYLFWSVSASKSVWVEKEWRCAFTAKGSDFIDPIPLVSPEQAPPPPELADKHFNDWTLALKKRS